MERAASMRQRRQFTMPSPDLFREVIQYKSPEREATLPLRACVSISVRGRFRFDDNHPHLRLTVRQGVRITFLGGLFLSLNVAGYELIRLEVTRFRQISREIAFAFHFLQFLAGRLAGFALVIE